MAVAHETSHAVQKPGRGGGWGWGWGWIGFSLKQQKRARGASTVGVLAKKKGLKKGGNELVSQGRKGLTDHA